MLSLRNPKELIQLLPPWNKVSKVQGNHIFRWIPGSSWWASSHQRVRREHSVGTWGWAQVQIQVPVWKWPNTLWTSPVWEPRQAGVNVHSRFFWRSGYRHSQKEQLWILSCSTSTSFKWTAIPVKQLVNLIAEYVHRNRYQVIMDQKPSGDGNQRTSGKRS